ncbi:MAG: hypothetical protein ABSB56_05200 [Nitrososphaerales archaeon]
MKNETVAAIMVTVTVLAFVAGLGSSTLILRGSNTSTTTTSSSISEVCSISAEGEVILQVLNSTSGKPIGSAPVHAQFLAPECPPNVDTTTTLSTTMTNSTGFITFGGEVGQYYLSVDGYTYSVVVSALPERVTCVTLGIPSGETNITYSQTFQFRC